MGKASFGLSDMGLLDLQSRSVWWGAETSSA